MYKITAYAKQSKLKYKIERSKNMKSEQKEPQSAFKPVKMEI